MSDMGGGWMTNARPDARLSELATRHAGAFSHAEARKSGLSQRQIDHRLGAGLWVVELPRVYRHASTPSTSLLRRHAALLWGGPNVVLSHRTAAAVWGIDAVADDSHPELTHFGDRRLHSRAVKVHRTRTFPHLDWTERDGLRVSRPSRNIVELAAVTTADPLEIAFESARRLRLVTASSVRERLDAVGARGRRGTARLGQLLGTLEGVAPAESALEVKVARKLRATGLPEPVRQHCVTLFGKQYRLDFAWPALLLALECDGRAFHEFQRDRTRWRQLGASGWRVLPITWHDVSYEWPAVLAELRSALATTGAR
ncbi:MAG: endonuclease domain-containing protein [Actinomycetota bacterium]